MGLHITYPLSMRSLTFAADAQQGCPAKPQWNSFRNKLSNVNGWRSPTCPSSPVKIGCSNGSSSKAASDRNTESVTLPPPKQMPNKVVQQGRRELGG